MDLTDIVNTTHSKVIRIHIFLKDTLDVLRDRSMLGQKTSLHKLKKIEIISSIFCDHNDIKLEINCKKKTENTHKYRKGNNMLLTNERVSHNIKEEIIGFLETNENEDIMMQNP